MIFQLSPRWPLYLIGSLIVLLSVLTIVGDRGALHLWRLHGEQSRLEEQNYRLQLANEALRQKITRVRNDNYYLEKLAREELNMVRPGEVVYRFAKPEPRRDPSASTAFESLPAAKPNTRR